MTKLAVMGLLLSGFALGAPVTCLKGSNIWGENIRTGKAFGESLETARQLSYLRFLNNLATLGRECLENEKGHLEFSPIQSFDGIQDPDTNTYWASHVVNAACCK